MKISEKQIMALINNTSALIARMIESGTNQQLIDECCDLLLDIERQQSTELKEI